MGRSLPEYLGEVHPLPAQIQDVRMADSMVSEKHYVDQETKGNSIC